MLIENLTKTEADFAELSDHLLMISTLVHDVKHTGNVSEDDLADMGYEWFDLESLEAHEAELMELHNNHPIWAATSEDDLVPVNVWF